MIKARGEDPLANHGRTLRWARRLTMLLLACFLLGVLPFLLERPYREMVFRRAERLRVVVYCDTTVFRGPVRAVALYDDMALKFLPRALGLFQNRPAARVRTFHPREMRVGYMNEYSLELEDVPDGPLVRIMLRDGERLYWVEVPERNIYRGQLSVRAQP